MGAPREETKRFKTLLRNYRKSLEDRRKKLEKLNKRDSL